MRPAHGMGDMAEAHSAERLADAEAARPAQGLEATPAAGRVGDIAEAAGATQAGVAEADIREADRAGRVHRVEGPLQEAVAATATKTPIS